MDCYSAILLGPRDESIAAGDQVYPLTTFAIAAQSGVQFAGVMPATLIRPEPTM
jgi:hypothetical protein